MITPEMLKPLIDKWGGVLEIVLDVSNESWCSTLVDNHSHFKASMELLSRQYTPENVVQELDEYFAEMHQYDSDLPEAVEKAMGRPNSDDVVYFSVNNWMYGHDYPPTDNFRKWLGNDLHQSFRDEPWVRENKLCVRCGCIDMSQNYCVTAPRKWVEENCPELLSNGEFTYTTMINDKTVEHKGRYAKFVYKPNADGVCEDRFGWPFLDYCEENIGVQWYEEDPEPEEDWPEELEGREDEDEGETSSED